MRRLVKLGIAALVIVVGAAAALWYFVLRTEAEPRAQIVETPTVEAPAASPDGSYEIAARSESFAGYRVTEKLVASVVRSDATGRTGDVVGKLTVSGTTISAVEVTVDMRTLSSDSSLRDGRMASSGIEYNRFPTSRFVLTAPITLPSAPAAGTTIDVQATGDLTLHGVTKRVTVPIQARWDGAQIQVVGNLPIAFSDYGITAPTSPLVASVDDRGEMEFHLFFARTQGATSLGDPPLYPLTRERAGAFEALRVRLGVR